MNCFSDVKKTGKNTSESRWMFRLREFILSLERSKRPESNESIFERRNFMNPGNHFFDARKKCGLSQEDVAKKLGVSRQTISKWETDETLPDIRRSKQILSCVS